MGIEEAPILLRPKIPDEHRASLFESGEVSLPEQRGERDRPVTIRADLPGASDPKGLPGARSQRRARRRRGAFYVQRRTGYLLEVHRRKGPATRIQTIRLPRISTRFPSQGV